MGLNKPKSQHSLDNLKYFFMKKNPKFYSKKNYFWRYLYTILNKNQTVTENNKDLLIETLRSISEILIWGDQNDSSVFEYNL
jgi:hypothetical protein